MGGKGREGGREDGRKKDGREGGKEERLEVAFRTRAPLESCE